MTGTPLVLDVLKRRLIFQIRSVYDDDFFPIHLLLFVYTLLVLGATAFVFFLW